MVMYIRLHALTIVSKEGGHLSRVIYYEEAEDLANVLKSGKMRAGVRIVQEDVVGPSLGQEAIRAGMISFIIA